MTVAGGWLSVSPPVCLRDYLLLVNFARTAGMPNVGPTAVVVFPFGMMLMSILNISFNIIKGAAVVVFLLEYT